MPVFIFEVQVRSRITGQKISKEKGKKEIDSTHIPSELWAKKFHSFPPGIVLSPGPGGLGSGSIQAAAMSTLWDAFANCLRSTLRSFVSHPPVRSCRREVTLEFVGGARLRPSESLETSAFGFLVTEAAATESIHVVLKCLGSRCTSITVTGMIVYKPLMVQLCLELPNCKWWPHFIRPLPVTVIKVLIKGRPIISMISKDEFLVISSMKESVGNATVWYIILLFLFFLQREMTAQRSLHYYPTRLHLLFYQL